MARSSEPKAAALTSARTSPRRNDAEWLNRTLATWKSETDTLPSLAYEQIDVMKMELPPGWRGYGAKDHIDHPDTARRMAEVEALKQQRDGADRFALQKKLMPYEHLLPKASVAGMNGSAKGWSGVARLG